MQMTVGNLAKHGDDGGIVGKGLAELNMQIKDLDPSVIDFAKRGFLGKAVNPIRRYFQRYERAENVIQNILNSLTMGKEQLKSDNVTLSIEEGSLRTATKGLMTQIALGMEMDTAIEQQIIAAQQRGEDSEKVRFIQEEILFPLRQRIKDMQTLVVVNQQGIIAMELVQRNNRELMRGVDRVSNVTVSALRTAVMVASSLYNQRITMEKINAITATTNNQIEATSRMLREQGTAIHKQASEATISVDALRNSFKDLFAAMEDIATFKQNALEPMKLQIAEFAQMAEESQKEIDKLERGSLLFAQIEEE
jgi:uncharacterized protein YaaN involved in tellurite resistance